MKCPECKEEIYNTYLCPYCNNDCETDYDDKLVNVTGGTNEKAFERAQEIVKSLADSDLEPHEIVFCVEMVNEIMKDWLKAEGITYKLKKVKLKK